MRLPWNSLQIPCFSHAPILLLRAPQEFSRFMGRIMSKRNIWTGAVEFFGRSKRFSTSWYFVPTVLGVIFPFLIFAGAFLIPGGWLPGDGQPCPRYTSAADKGQGTAFTIFDWLKCGSEGGESNGAALRNLGLLIAGFYALIFAFWRAKIADTEKELQKRQNDSLRDPPA